MPIRYRQIVRVTKCPYGAILYAFIVYSGLIDVNRHIWKSSLAIGLQFEGEVCCDGVLLSNRLPLVAVAHVADVVKSGDILLVFDTKPRLRLTQVRDPVAVLFVTKALSSASGH